MREISGAAFDGLAVVEVGVKSSPRAPGALAVAGVKVVLTAGPLVLEVSSVVNDTWSPEVTKKARELLDAIEAHLAARPPFTMAAPKRQTGGGIV